MEFFNHIHCKYTGIKGFITLYNDAVRYRYMITEKALKKARILTFWGKYGLAATQDAFKVAKRTLYDWKKKWQQGGRKPEALNEKSKTPRIKRKRLWSAGVLEKIKQLRQEHPNLGSEKIHSLLAGFCVKNNLLCPKPRTIANLIKDLGGLRIFPKKVSHFGKIKKVDRQKVLRKPKDFIPQYPGHLIALDTVERFINGCRRYIITFSARG